MFAKFMNKKFFHPGSYPNEKQKWIKQQKHAANEKVEKEKQAVYQKEQESYQSRLLSAKTTEEKLKVDLNFMYDVPPGMQRKDGEDDQDDKDDDKEKEVRFEWQKHAPRSKYVKDLGLDCQDQPFGVCVRNIRCFTCKAWGHQNTDRECPLFFANVNSEVNAKVKQEAEEEQASSSGSKPSGLEKCSLRLSDPLLLMNEMKEKHGLALKKSVIGKEIDPMVEMSDNQKIIASDDEDTELREVDIKFVESLTNKEKRKLLKKLNKLERREKQDNYESLGKLKSKHDQFSSNNDDIEQKGKIRKGKLKKKRKREASGSDEELELEQSNKHGKKKRSTQNRRASATDSDSPDEYSCRSNKINQSKQRKLVECEFYSKTGCCPLGRGCMDDHPPPDATSSTIIIQNFIQYPTSSRQRELDRDFYRTYSRFYEHAYSDLSAIGEIVMFLCCCNEVSHLRGTVFVQFASRRHALEAIKMLHRTYYDKQLRVKLIPTLNWRSAICGLFAAGKCPQYEDCNFLHIFNNPEEMGSSKMSEDEAKTCSSKRRRSVCDDGKSGKREERGSSKMSEDEAKTCSSKRRRRVSADGNSGKREERGSSKMSEDEAKTCSSKRRRSVSADGKSGKREEKASSVMSEDEANICFSYRRIGVCADGKSCERLHPESEQNTTLLLPNFFQHPKLQQPSEEMHYRLYDAFKVLYRDFIEVFRSFGTVLFCKCSHDAAKHLAGNFYVQYASPSNALHARNILRAQDVTAELVPEINWSRVICKDHYIRKGDRLCRRGSDCELLHMFVNPR